MLGKKNQRGILRNARALNSLGDEEVFHKRSNTETISNNRHGVIWVTLKYFLKYRDKSAGMATVNQ